jgi:hypothetical protein
MITSGIETPIATLLGCFEAEAEMFPSESGELGEEGSGGPFFPGSKVMDGNEWSVPEGCPGAFAPAARPGVPSEATDTAAP